MANIKIGLVTYTGASISITGTYASRVTTVITSGAYSSTVSCSSCSKTDRSTTVDPLSSAVTDQWGSTSMVCLYSGASMPGGCNTLTQVDATFASEFGESIDFIKCQYGAYSSGTTLKLSEAETWATC